MKRRPAQCKHKTRPAALRRSAQKVNRSVAPVKAPAPPAATPKVAAPPRATPKVAHPPATAVAGYDAIKERARQRQAGLSASGRNIGGLPAVVNPERRERCRLNLRAFLLEYFPEAFPIPFSADHEKVIAKIQTAVLAGGLFAIAMPRGSGKSTICERATLWAELYGHRRFVVIISAEAGLAEESLASVTTELENNDRLNEDFPSVCYPIRCLEGIHQRAAGQLYEGQRTQITLTENEIVLPTIPDSNASGAITRVAGITGRIRGMKATTSDGQVIRPDLVLLDDPQTDESARSITQCAQRERVLKGAILGLAGPGQRIAGLAAVTVVQCDDLAERLLDRKLHPQWQGERTQAVYNWGTGEKLWAEYVELRRRTQRENDGAPETITRICNEFYAAHRADMDAGAVVAWAERKEPEDLSALQHAWNIRADRGDAAYMAEYQNAPLPEISVGPGQLEVDQVAEKTNGYERCVIPISCTVLTAFIDVQEAALWYVVTAWEPDFTGYVVDYGTEPDQGLPYFTTHDITRTLKTSAPGVGQMAAIYAGLDRLVERIVGSEWRREDGAAVRVERCLIDANWGQSTNTVYKLCREHAQAGVLTPSHGVFVGASSKPLNDVTKKPGDKVGLNWRMPVQNAAKRAVRYVLIDTNFWKGAVRNGLFQAIGDPGCISLFGRKPHRMFADHITAEYSVRTVGRGRTVDEFKMRAAGLDNHWLDGLVGTAVAAAMSGCNLEGTAVNKPARSGPKRNLGDLLHGQG